MYGDKVPREYSTAQGTDVIGAVDLSPAGNIVLRIGRTSTRNDWSQLAHVVLLPSEYIALGIEISDLIDERTEGGD